MTETKLFDTAKNNNNIDIFLGKWPCDVPFGGGELELVNITLTNNSPKSQNKIPILRLHAGHQMDFEAHEQTPAGHAALLVAQWLNDSDIEESTRYAAELFLWQWPGIRQLDNDQWQLANFKEREDFVHSPILDFQAQNITLKNKGEYAAMLLSLNLQVQAYGFCRKGAPCYLLDACLLCPFFATNKHFISSLQKRTAELQNRREEAVASNNNPLADSCHQALIHLESILIALSKETDDNKGEKQ